MKYERKESKRMSLGIDTLKNDERAVFELRSLYRRYGYKRFKMSRFEEYDLYVKNKDFLVSDRMITFTDLDGTLLALKPDVTISIMKNSRDLDGTVHKVYYNENVYRALKGQDAFREIMQAGLECIGNVDFYHVCEVITLAAKSLASISGEYVLDVSHLGFVAELMLAAGVPEAYYGQVLRYVREKNTSELERLCEALKLSGEGKHTLMRLVLTYGDMREVLDELHTLAANDGMRQALGELEQIYAVLAKQGLSQRVRLDFSVVNDMNYYNGIVFQGFVRGIPSSILSGGQYDRLMQKMGKTCGAIGFAVYLDELELLERENNPYDVDVLLLYGESTDPGTLFDTVERLTAADESVLAQRSIPENIRYKRLVVLDGGER